MGIIERFGARAVATVAGIFGLVLLVLFAVNSCQSSKTATKQAEVSGRQGQASVNAGAGAVQRTGQVATNDASTDDQVARSQAAVRAAPDGLKGAVAKREACKFKAYQNTPQCKGK